MRDLNSEFTDNDHRRYAYHFDYRMHDYMLRQFQPLLPKGRALELGCYHGVFTERLADLYDNLTVVEGASDLVRIARERLGCRANFICSRFEDFTPQHLFDAVFLMHTLEHLDNPVDVLTRISSWLAPNGRLFVVVPNAFAASRQIAVSMGLIAKPEAVTPGEAQHGHRRTYSLDRLKQHIGEAGLRIEEAGGILFKPLANFQFDRCLEAGIVDDAFLDGCFDLGRHYPELCASIYTVCAHHNLKA